MKAATRYSEKPFFKNRYQQQRLGSSNYEGTQPLVKFLINTCLWSEFSAQFCRNWIAFPFSGSDVHLQKNQFYPYDPTKLAVRSILRPEDDFLSNFGWNFKRTVSFYDIVHFIDEENILNYGDLDCGIIFYPETPPKSDRSSENGIKFPDAVKNSSTFPVTINKTVLLMRSINLISFWTHIAHGTWFQQLLCHSATLMIDNLCPTSTLNQQLTNIELTQVRCSLQCEEWTVRGRDCASGLHYFNEITYQTDEWSKQLLGLKSWVTSWNPEQWMEFHRLWWTVIVFKCSYLFHLFGLYCLLMQYFLFFLKIYFFCSLPLMTFSEK